MKILVTGGAGYIGSITNYVLRTQGHETVIVDNLSSGHKEAVFDTEFYEMDLLDAEKIKKVCSENHFDAVIHFAALALAGESMEKPYEYYKNNIIGGLNLLESMRLSGIKNIIFSSTCAVYGYPKKLPVTEDMPYAPVSVYGASKRNFEEILEWYENIYGIRYALLRYFNASGALSDGMLGEAHPIETHIIPKAIDVAMGKSDVFKIYGENYNTPDGTCVRDYIHVEDLAEAHIKAVAFLINNNRSLKVNLGVGKGYSNKEIINTVEKVSGQKIRCEVVPRRPGDPDSIYADNTRAKKLLDWEPKYKNIEDIIKTAWKWHSTHPNLFK